jgi:hypothetical protein
LNFVPEYLKSGDEWTKVLYLKTEAGIPSISESFKLRRERRVCLDLGKSFVRFGLLLHTKI